MRAQRQRIDTPVESLFAYVRLAETPWSILLTIALLAWAIWVRRDDLAAPSRTDGALLLAAGIGLEFLAILGNTAVWR